MMSKNNKGSLFDDWVDVHLLKSIVSVLKRGAIFVAYSRSAVLMRSQYDESVSSIAAAIQSCRMGCCTRNLPRDMLDAASTRGNLGQRSKGVQVGEVLRKPYRNAPCNKLICKYS